MGRRKRRGLVSVAVAVAVALVGASGSGGGTSGTGAGGGVSAALAVFAGRAASAGPAPAPVEADADDLGTSWYPDADLPPDQVNAGDFGPRFSTQLDGQIYAQPLVADGVLVVVTEADMAYGLDPVTGAVVWTRSFGTPWDPSVLNCGDLTPTVGITGTPVVDAATGVAYFTTETATTGDVAAWSVQAVDVRTGAEAQGFPVAVAGTATNDPAEAFDAEYQMQRPGLALVGGTVYAAFGSHCDHRPYEGWIAGVGEHGGLTDLWSDEIGSGSAAGIWAPGGLVSDAAGDLYFATGNGSTPAPGPGLGVAQPTGGAGLGECVVKLSTSGGRLRLADYFCPADAARLNAEDGDLGSGSPTGLPASFGTAATPDLLVQVGKAGELYLLDRDDLGGVGQGPAGSDDVIEETGPLGGAWSHPAVWPGDGGYVYVVTGGPSGVDEGTGELDVYQRVLTDGVVGLEWVGDVPGFPFGSSSPVVSSAGETAGSGIVWVVAGGSGTPGAMLQAYGVVPVAAAGSGQPALPLLWQGPIGDSAKFATPLVDDGTVYVGTKDGQVLAFGTGASVPPLAGGSVTAPATDLGASASASATLTASGPVTVTGISLRDTTSGATTAFAAGDPSPSLPVSLAAGGALVIPLTFAPEVLGDQQGVLTVTTTTGTVSVPIDGDGLAATEPVQAAPASVDFGLRATGSAPASTPVTLTDTTAAAVTVTAVGLASGTAAPFSLSGVGALPATLQPGQALRLSVDFTPPGTSGDFAQGYNDRLDVTTSAGDTTVPLAGASAPGPELAVGASTVDVGTVPVGGSGYASFTVANPGGIDLHVTASTPPDGGGFAATTALPVGTVIPAHTTRTETVVFRARRPGFATSSWVIAGDGGQPARTVVLHATARREDRLPAPDARWVELGSATIAGRYLELTPPTAEDAAGMALAPSPVSSAGLRASFFLRAGGGTGGNGVTLALVDAVGGRPRRPGRAGGALGLAGLAAVGVALQTAPSRTEAGANTVGVVTADRSSSLLHWVASTSTIPPLRPGPTLVTVTVADGTIAVAVDGLAVLRAAVTLPPSVYVGFSAGTGSLTDAHLVSSVQLSVP